jgi:hypothetical protein
VLKKEQEESSSLCVTNHHFSFAKGNKSLCIIVWVWVSDRNTEGGQICILTILIFSTVLLVKKRMDLRVWAVAAAFVDGWLQLLTVSVCYYGRFLLLR